MRAHFFHPLLLLLLPAAFGAQATAHSPQDAQAVVWIEGESAARHNFPPISENPFRPKAFWESDLLSGGEWIGALWREGEPQPFLEFDIEVPEAAVYSLYVRKFYTYGKFRWCIGDGPWHEPPDQVLHTPLDHVAMREEGERISLNWFYMGECELPAGRQTLRIEPIRGRALTKTTIGVGTPLAYDAIVLTRGLFFPTGRLKPGDKHPLRDPEGFAFQPELDSFSPTALDLRNLNEPFAGARGGISVHNGRLVFRDNKEPVRLLGVNFDPWRLVSPAALDYMARSLAKRGINFVRFDFGKAVEFSMQSSAAGPEKLNIEFHEPALAHLARVIHTLKKQGIYTALTWDIETSQSLRSIYDPEGVSPRPSPSDPQTPGLYDNSMPSSLAALRIFEPDVRQACLQVWERILGLQLEDGSTLGKDPALFLITLAQQSSLLEENSLPWEKLPPPATAAALDQWQQWIATRYGSVDKALAAWGTSSTADAERPPDVRSILARRDAWASDALRFLVETQRNDYAALVKSLRDRGCTALISASNQSVDHPELLGFAEIESRSPGDVIERHGKLVSDFSPKYDIWNFTEGALFGERSIVRLDALQGFEAARFELPFKAPAYPGRPSLLSEIGVALPNRYSGEFPLVALTLATLQDVQAVGFSTLATENWQGSLSSARIQIFTPAILGQMPALAYAYRKGLLPGPSLAGRLELSDDSVFSLRPAPFHEAPDTQINASPRLPEQSESQLQIAPALWLAGKVEVHLGSKKEIFDVADHNALRPDGSIQAAGGAVRWNPSARLLVVDTPAFQAVSGALREASPVRLTDVEIKSDMETGTICAVALDGQPLAFSKRILVQVFTQESNNGLSAAQIGNLAVIRSSGRPPLQVKTIKGVLTFARPDADSLYATALDANGHPLLTANEGAQLRLLPSTMYYLVEK